MRPESPGPFSHRHPALLFHRQGLWGWHESPRVKLLCLLSFLMSPPWVRRGLSESHLELDMRSWHAGPTFCELASCDSPHAQNCLRFGFKECLETMLATRTDMIESCCLVIWQVAGVKPSSSSVLCPVAGGVTGSSPSQVLCSFIQKLPTSGTAPSLKPKWNNENNVLFWRPSCPFDIQKHPQIRK